MCFLDFFFFSLKQHILKFQSLKIDQFIKNKKYCVYRYSWPFLDKRTQRLVFCIRKVIRKKRCGVKSGHVPIFNYLQVFVFLIFFNVQLQSNQNGLSMRSDQTAIFSSFGFVDVSCLSFLFFQICRCAFHRQIS